MDAFFIYLGLSMLPVVAGIVGALLRWRLGRLPGWFFAGGWLLCAVLVIWPQIWMMQQDGGLEILGALMTQAQALATAIVLIIWWVVLYSVRKRRSTEQQADAALSLS